MWLGNRLSGLCFQGWSKKKRLIRKYAIFFLHFICLFCTVEAGCSGRGEERGEIQVHQVQVHLQSLRPVHLAPGAMPGTSTAGHAVRRLPRGRQATLWERRLANHGGGLLERSEEALVGYKRMIQDGVLKEKCKLCSRTFCGQEREKCEGRDFRRWK